MASFFTDYKPIRDLWFSSKLILEVNWPILKTSQKAFRHLAIVVWNSLPLTVREYEAIGTLKKQLKSYPYNVPKPVPNTHSWLILVSHIVCYKFFVLIYLLVWMNIFILLVIENHWINVCIARSANHMLGAKTLLDQMVWNELMWRWLDIASLKLKYIELTEISPYTVLFCKKIQAPMYI